MNKFSSTKVNAMAMALLPMVLHMQPSSATELSKHLTTVVTPEPIKRVHPKYPQRAAREGRSGWSKFSFIVEKDGTVSNIVEIDSSGSTDFSLAAKTALKRWRYQPAMENGEPVQQCLNTVQMDFKMSNGSDGVRRRFGKTYKKAIAALEAKDYPKLEELLAKLKDYDYRHIGENNYLHTISALYAEQQGDKKQELYHLSNISYINDDKQSLQHKFSVLNKRLKLAIELNQFKSALDIYQQLTELEQSKPYLETYQRLMTQISTLIDSPKDFAVAGDIQDKDYWHYDLVRNEFSITDIQGQLNKMDVRCANKRHVYTIENNNTWSIPETWKNCSLLIYGDNHSQFTLVEHGAKS